MSQANVEVAWRAAEAFNRTLVDGGDEFYEFLDDDVQWAPITALLDGVTHRGVAAVRAWVDELRRDWDTYELVWDEVRALDDERVLATGSWHARGRRSGVELNVPQAAWLLQFRAGKAIRVQTFTDPGKALEAAAAPSTSGD